ncbi:MAG: isoleucine--tRNA ligase [Candidatus Gottesmanbacteria bacterium]
MFKFVDPKVNFPEMEKKILKWWDENGLVQKYLQKNNSSKKTFSFLDGPITANNPMGVHHAWGRTYKDLWQRFHNMKGEKQRFQNGFDCQGLWVEVEVEKELKLKSKKDIENLVSGDKYESIAKFVNLCKERVRKYAQIQTEQSQRLGFFMDWDHSYFTMADDNNYMIWHLLKVCWENGWIYKGKDSVPWCPRCETAISEHEILTEDYKEITHDSVILKFPIVERQNEFLLVWTTTPWTIPANIAVAVDNDIDYSLVEGESGQKYWLASLLVKNVFTNKAYKIIKTEKGSSLIGLHYKGAFDPLEVVEKAAKENPDLFHSVVPTDKLLMPISTDEGTGMVHTAVSAGAEDFKLGKKLGLPMIPVITDNADYVIGLGEFSGKNAKNNPKIIIDYLKDKEANEGIWLFNVFPYFHRYPVCWRCKTELVWKVADEWYIAMDRGPSRMQNSECRIQNATLRQRMIDVAKKIQWIPGFGLDRELDWLKNMHDWLISKKNRYWGLALPIYECQKCGNFEIIGGKEELKKRAVAGFAKFDPPAGGHSPHKPWIDDVKIKCRKCGELVARIPDVGNPWLDAGIVPFSTISLNNQGQPLYWADKKEWRMWFPADFITESFPGQFKNWFYSLIAQSTILENEIAFKTVLGFGTLIGEDGRPMHKSWGNAIEFNEGADKIGVDVMRWMYTTQNPADNLLFGYHKADEVRRRFHLTLWNIYNFFVTYANADAWKRKQVTRNTKHVLDKWIISRLNGLIKTVTDSLDKYDAQTASLSIETFVQDLSLWYVRRSRGRIGPTATDKKDKEACYLTLYETLVTLSRLLAPFTPFLAEEIYQNLTKEESVHLANWPKYDEKLIDLELEKEQRITRQLVEIAHSLRKDAEIKVRQPLNSLTTISGIDLSRSVNLIKDEVNVKNLEIKVNKSIETIDVSATKLDTKITPELREEGELRDLIRDIQGLRKEQGLKPDDKITVQVPVKFKKFKDDISSRTNAKNILWGDSLKISTG